MPDFYHNGSTLSAEEVRRRFDYDPLTGIFLWAEPPHKHPRLRGQRAGTTHDGYRYIGINRGLTKANQLAWLHYYGRWQASGLVVDHINGDSLDDRIENLREVTLTINNQNHLKGTRENGLPCGVTYHPRIDKYQALITSNKKRFYLGLFATADEASAAYIKARITLHDCPAFLGKS